MIYRSPYLHLAVWLGILMIYIGIFSRFLGFGEALFRGLSHIVLMSGLFYFNWWLLRHWRHPERSIRYWVLALLMFGLVTLIRTSLSRHLPGESALPFTRIEGQIPWFWGSLFSNFGIMALSYLFHLNERRITAEREQLIQSQHRRTAELQQLRTHINPHFLFNVLNNIYSLATTGSSKTAQTVLQLSQLLRYLTYYSQRDVVSLELEVEQMRRYIQLFQLRSPEPFDIQLEVIGEIDGKQIEPMLLLPLLENAFKHGDFVSNPAAFAHFELMAKEGNLYFRGSNSFDPSEQQKDELSGVGLPNIQERLHLSYGEDRSNLSWANDTTSVFKVELNIQSAF